MWIQFFMFFILYVYLFIFHQEKSTPIIVDSEENGLYMSNLEIQNTYFLDTGYIYCFPEGSSTDSPETAKIYLYVNGKLIVYFNLVKTRLQYFLDLRYYYWLFGRLKPYSFRNHLCLDTINLWFLKLLVDGAPGVWGLFHVA